jgi:hypothetical protein
VKWKRWNEKIATLERPTLFKKTKTLPVSPVEPLKHLTFKAVYFVPRTDFLLNFFLNIQRLYWPVSFYFVTPDKYSRS